MSEPISQLAYNYIKVTSI